MYQNIEINDLLLDESNPRLEDIVNQDDALEKIILDQGVKLVNLAKDIIDVEATNPSELPIVVPSPTTKKKYIVLEGNRRLAVLRLLWNHALIDRIENNSIRTEFHRLSKEFHKSPISYLQCYVAKSREDADHWRQLRHTGSNNGVGTVWWNAAAISRFSKQLGVTNYNSAALQLIDHLKQEPSFSDDSKRKLDDVKITNLGRLINDPDIRKDLGIRIDGGELDISSLDKDVMTNLETLIDGISADSFKVRQIYHKDDRKEYVKSLGIVPAKQGVSDSGNNGKANDGPANGGQQSQDGSKNKAKKSNPLSTSRKTLIPSSSIIKIGHSRLNKIYRELRELEVDHYENCVAVMLRVFLELSIDEYASGRNIPAYSESSQLSNKIKAITDYMEKNKLLDPKKLKAIRVEASNPHSLISTNTLNAYVHNKDLEPKATELKITWNNIEDFIMKLWE